LKFSSILFYLLVIVEFERAYAKKKKKNHIKKISAVGPEKRKRIVDRDTHTHAHTKKRFVCLFYCLHIAQKKRRENHCFFRHHHLFVSNINTHSIYLRAHIHIFMWKFHSQQLNFYKIDLMYMIDSFVFLL
jgi:hypothetical protein